jgi:ribosomal protein S9
MFYFLFKREQLLFPFKITNTINKFDIKMTVNDGGMSCLAKGSRYAISNALCNFLNEIDLEKLRIGT